MEYSGANRQNFDASASGQSNMASLIDRVTSFDGTLRTERDLRIEGKVTGAISCDGILMIAEGAEVDAEVDAESIIVSGEMAGTVRCRGRLEIRASGIVRGDVKTGALVIVEGARYEGQIAMEATYEGGGAFTPQPADEQDVDDLPAQSNEQEYSFLRRFTPSEDEMDDEETEDES